MHASEDSNVSSAVRPVLHCRNSTITEAWAVIAGLAAPVDDTDASVIMRAGRAKLADLRETPALVTLPPQGGVVQPFWRHQVEWGNRKFLARFGHRYLSVHFVSRDGVRYDRFDQTMDPALSVWLDIVQSGLGASAGEQPLDAVGFGYVNTFELDAGDFDLSRYFNLTFGFEVSGQRVGLLSFSTTARFVDLARNVRISFELVVEAPSLEDRHVRVLTKVLADRKVAEGATFTSKSAIMDEVRLTKDGAKEAFFGLVTEKTKSLMGAEYAESSAR